MPTQKKKLIELQDRHSSPGISRSFLKRKGGPSKTEQKKTKDDVGEVTNTEDTDSDSIRESSPVDDQDKSLELSNSSKKPFFKILLQLLIFSLYRR